MPTHLTSSEMPNQDGVVAIVTGASSGLGLAAADALAAKGADVVLAVRNQNKGDAAMAAIRARHPHAKLSVSLVDLASLASIRDFARRSAETLSKVDILVNNAGLGLQPTRATTIDGFEMQFGTNHLGPFALTGLLLPLLLNTPAPRVVAVSSIAHSRGFIDFDDLQGERGYSGIKAYAQSKLADLMFAFELDRRALAAGATLVSVAAHPGMSGTGFFAASGMPWPIAAALGLAARFIGQPAERGAWPILYAATMPDVDGGQYWGPNGMSEIKGFPALAKIAPQARDRAVAAKLWEVSEKLTGVTYERLDRAA